MRSVSGTVTRTAPVTMLLAISVVPTPNATHPTAPLCGVCESVPAISCPGSAYCSAITACEIPLGAFTARQVTVVADTVLGDEGAVRLGEMPHAGNEAVLEVDLAAMRVRRWSSNAMMVRVSCSGAGRPKVLCSMWVHMPV